MLIIHWVILVLVFVALLAFWYFQRYTVKVKRYTVQVNNLPHAFRGFTILQLSDLHSKRFGKQQKDLAGLIRQQSFDLVALTGDFVEGVAINHKVDLVLAGHTHGGQIRLPFAGAVVAPGQGLFPKWDYGKYKAGATTMIINPGLGESDLPIRVNIRPEIGLITLLPGGEGRKRRYKYG